MKKMNQTINSSLAAIAIAVAASTSALASDGVIEINQARAEAGNVTVGDSPGFPVTLSAKGSYLLTSNLDAGAESGIEITAPDVTVDLNGFKLSGTAVDGSKGINSTFVGSRVRDGVVQSFNSGGIHLDDDAVVENVRVTDSNSHGISVGNNSRVTNCQAVRHGLRGIGAGNNAVVSGNISQDSFIGIRADGGVIRDNTVQGDGNIGIQAEGRPTVVINNTVNGDWDIGLAMSSSVGYGGNSISGGTNHVNNNGVQIGPNLCGTNLCQ